MWETVFREVFRAQYGFYLERVGKASAVRRFADFIDLSPSATSEILSGKREWRLSPARARRIVEKFALPTPIHERLLRLIENSDQRTWAELPRADAKLLTDWTYLAVLLCHDLPCEHQTPESIAHRLCIPVEKVECIMIDLINYGLIKADATGVRKRAEETWTTTEDLPDPVIQAHHRENLGLAESALSRVPVEERDFSSLTFVASIEQIHLLKKEIRRLYEFAQALTETPGPDAKIIRMSAQVFPLDGQAVGSDEKFAGPNEP